MGEPWAIVVVPTEAGRALTAEGLCGAKPPLVWLSPRDGGWGRWVNVLAGRMVADAVGLPLRWNGVVVPEGIDRAERVWVAAAPRRCRVDVVELSVVQVRLLAESLERDGLCRVVVLDLVDGAVVERAP